MAKNFVSRGHLEIKTGSYKDKFKNVLIVDAIFCFTVILSLLFNVIIGSLTPLIVLSSIPLFLVIHPDRFIRVIGISWPVLLLPTFALISVFWSSQPEATLRYGFLFFSTVLVGTIFGAGVRNEVLFISIFTSLLSFVVLSLAFGRFVNWGEGEGMAFAGLLGSKNAMGETSGIALLASVAAVFYANQRRSFALLFTAFAGIILSGLCLWLSKATGALIATGIASICLILWSLSRSLSAQIRTLIFLLALVILIIGILTSDLWLPAIFEFVLEASGKDAGLTGRAELWAKADQMIARKPWFGMGYESFWRLNNLDAEYLWRLMGIRNRSGFNFHNTAREITVALGYVGLLIYLSVFVIGSLALIVKAMRAPTLPLIFFSSLAVYFAFKLHTESFGFGGVQLLTLLAYTILTIGYSGIFRSRR